LKLGVGVWFNHPIAAKRAGGFYPKVNTELFNRVLADFAQHFGVSQDKQILLALDQAAVAYG